jgi:hypothetical protein
MVNKCVVCGNKETNNPHLSFFAITPDKDQLKKWIEVIESHVPDFNPKLLFRASTVSISIFFNFVL